MHLFAYIDPGAGALIWQSIIGVFVGVLFYLRKTRRWIGKWIAKIFHEKTKTPVPMTLPISNESSMGSDRL